MGKTGDRSLQATARYWRAYLLAQTGRFPDAARAAEEANAFFKKASDDRGEGVTLILQGNIADMQELKREAKAFVEQALEISKGISDTDMEKDASTLLDRIEGKGNLRQYSRLSCSRL